MNCILNNVIFALYWLLDTGQIVDDLAPISRLEGDIFYRECSILDCNIAIPAGVYPALDTGRE